MCELARFHFSFNALALQRSDDEEEAMPSHPVSDSDDEVQVIAEVKATRRKKPKKEVISDSDDNEKDSKNGVDDDDSSPEERRPLVRRAVPATVRDEPSTSRRTRKTQKNCDPDASSSKS